MINTISSKQNFIDAYLLDYYHIMHLRRESVINDKNMHYTKHPGVDRALPVYGPPILNVDTDHFWSNWYMQMRRFGWWLLGMFWSFRHFVSFDLVWSNSRVRLRKSTPNKLKGMSVSSQMTCCLFIRVSLIYRWPSLPWMNAWLNILMQTISRCVVGRYSTDIGLCMRRRLKSGFRQIPWARGYLMQQRTLLLSLLFASSRLMPLLLIYRHLNLLTWT